MGRIGIYNEERQNFPNYQCKFPSLPASSTKDVPEKECMVFVFIPIVQTQ